MSSSLAEISPRSASRKHAYIILTPLNPHFYIVKLGFTGVYIIFLISAQKHRLWVLVRTAVLTSTHNLCFEQIFEKYQSFLPEKIRFLEVKFSIYLNRRVFVMLLTWTNSRQYGCTGSPEPLLFAITALFPWRGFGVVTRCCSCFNER